ncbi:ATP-binding protein [Desulfurococcus amylolyticus]|uniref:ATP-binding protein n=1 Tax=Desulfurococcus amylolyticus TaxID=94694 RepID=UPI002277289F|nr:ATP-binding protein [Desulfurococcus amylolyticus]
MDKWLRFVDRDLEMRQLLSFASRGYAFPIAMYSPEGCCKAILLKFFINSIKGGDAMEMHINVLETRDIRNALFVTDETMWKVIESIAINVAVGSGVARASTTLLRRLHEKLSLRGKTLVVVVDDIYKAIGINEVDRYTKMLYKFIGYLHQEFRVSKAIFIIATFEGVSKRIVSKHNHVHVYMGLESN